MTRAQVQCCQWIGVQGQKEKAFGGSFQKAGSAPPTHTTQHTQRSGFRRTAPFSQIQGVAYDTRRRKHPAGPGLRVMHRKRVEPGKEETLKIQTRWLSLCKIFTKQAHWVIFSSQSAILYREQNLFLMFSIGLLVLQSPFFLYF